MEKLPITIVIVDDSIIIRGIINRMLSKFDYFKVVGTAIDGQSAVRMAQELQPDFVILDINMPRKDGLEALPEIIAASPATKVIIASSMTNQNAELSMKALGLGASECLHMPDANNAGELKRFERDLVNCIIELANVNPILLNTPRLCKETISTVNIVAPTKSASGSNHLQAIAIASSTGGPHALAELFKQLKGNIPNVPIFITQHMPPTFTSILAKNIASASGVVCKEGVDGEIALPQHIYIAPGDYHMTPIKSGNEVIIKINQGAMENYCRPAADPMMRALVNIYGKNMMMLVLTGMGHDGLAGARALAESGGAIVVQDKASSVVWGMPKAVAEAGIANAVLPLDAIANHIINAFKAGARGADNATK